MRVLYKSQSRKEVCRTHTFQNRTTYFSVQNNIWTLAQQYLPPPKIWGFFPKAEHHWTWRSIYHNILLYKHCEIDWDCPFKQMTDICKQLHISSYSSHKIIPPLHQRCVPQARFLRIYMLLKKIIEIKDSQRITVSLFILLWFYLSFPKLQQLSVPCRVVSCPREERRQWQSGQIPLHPVYVQHPSFGRRYRGTVVP